MQKYKLEITEEQAQVIRNALDLYTRIGIGQLKEIWWVWGHNKDVCKCDRRTFDAYLTDLQLQLTGFPLNASWGIHSLEVHDVFRQAYDLHQVIRNKLAWTRYRKEHPGSESQPRDHSFAIGTGTIDFDNPRKTALEDVPLATIEVVKDGD